jgi:serine/threonine-protein kinase
MGEVRRVYDRQLGRTLALKIIHAPAMQQAGFVARFLEEAQATAQLQHPNIVPVYDLGELPDGRLWFTMQEVSGQTLGQVIVQLHEISEDRWKIPESGWGLRRVVDALRQVCEGVGYAHSRGVVHRDLKPANIMVGAHGEVLVLDWGLAKVLGNAEKQPEEEPLIPVLTDRSAALSHPTMVGAVAGTPAYMPPEQAQGRVGGIDARSDVYALGAVLYQILAGRPPYFGESVATVLDQVRSGPPVPLRKTAHLIRVSNLRREDASDDVQAGPPLPGALVDACERAMARSPDERYSSAGELAIALQAWLDGSQRRQDALLVVEQAASNAPKAAELRAQAKTLRAEAKAMLEGIESWRSEEAKAPGWAKEDQAIALEKQAELTELEEEQLLHASLTHARDLPEAHAALVARYRAEHQAAELARIDATRAEVLMREHLSGLPRNHPERANHVAYLRGNGLLSLATDPPGAEVLLHKYVLHNRRFVPQFERSLGVTPISKVSLPMGSYLVVLKHPERAEVRYPINIERQQHWDGVPPDSSSPDIVPLPLQNELTLNECYLPPGWFWSGGDTEVRNGLPRRRLWLGGLVIQRFPVTNRMYLDFLDDLVAQGRTEEALTHAPRERAGTAGEQGALICGFDGVNFTLRPDADGDIWDPDYPVTMIDWHAAGAYAAWFSARTGQSWRLPNELEWEKAARGVDGRLYPWGDGFDPSWACMKESHAGRLLPAVVDTYPIDESPYGVRGMAGNSVDWCLDRYLPHGASLTSLRVDSLVAEPDQPDDVYRVLRGGGWFNAASELDTSHRRYLDANYRGFDLGFRLVRPYSYP